MREYGRRKYWIGLLHAGSLGIETVSSRMTDLLAMEAAKAGASGAIWPAFTQGLCNVAYSARYHGHQSLAHDVQKCHCSICLGLLVVALVRFP